jgi:1-aminocyclopropane-1-carboxylate deaminase
LKKESTMVADHADIDWLHELADWPRERLALLPTPIHRLPRLARELGEVDLWIKRDDLTGLPGGGNKTRKLEFLAGDAKATGADTLVTVGAIQSNHTRQTAAAARRAGLECALLHVSWTADAGPYYRSVGNILLSSLLGAELFYDAEQRPIEDNGPLEALAEHLRRRGRVPYVFPGGGSDHRLGSFGYAVCAAEIIAQAAAAGVEVDYVVHCSGSGGTQAGLVAGFAALGATTHVIGIPDDEETVIKRARVLRLANATLEELGRPERVSESDVEIVAGDLSPYGVADEKTHAAMRLLAATEGLIADPVYEGKALDRKSVV